MSEQQPVETIHEQPFSTIEWQRLSPVSIIFFLGRSLLRLLKEAIPGLAPLAVVIFNSDNKFWMAIYVLAFLLIATVVGSVLQFLFFKFHFGKDKVLVHEGVFKKKQRTLSFERIQNINIIQPFYFKFFSLVSLELESAGSKGNEVNLAGIPIGSAEQLKAEVLAFQSESEKVVPSSQAEQIDGVSDNPVAHSDQGEQLLATANLKQLVRFGVTNNGMFWFLVFLSPFMGAIDNIIEDWIGEENLKSFVELLGGKLQGGSRLVSIIFLSIIILMILFSVIGSIFRYYNYKLTQNRNTLKRHSGLLSTYEESLKLPKIQAIVRQTNFIGKWLKVENLFIKQASNPSKQSGPKSNQFVIPSRSSEQSNKLIALFFKSNEEFSDLSPINRRYIYKNFAIFAVVPVAITSLLFYQSSNFWTLAILLILPIIWSFFNLRWKNFGYQLNEEFACFRSGLWGYKKTNFPLFKAQRVEISQSIWQKKRGLANLTIYLASNPIRIPYMNYQDALDWYNQISLKTEQTERNWF